MADEKVRKQFLDAIAAASWDDPLPRLVYADWLEENDEPEEADRQRNYVPAERYLRELADKFGGTEPDYPYYGGWVPITFEDLIAAGRQWLSSGSHFTQMGSGVARDVMHYEGVCERYWQCWEVITGIRVPSDARGIPFSCSC